MIFGFASAMCLGCVCFPQPYMHAYASRTAKGFKVMLISFGGLCILIITCTTFVGIASTVIIPGLAGVEADKVFGLVSADVLPNWLAALVVSGGFAAAMSTVNGLVLGNATNISVDFYRLVNPSAKPAELVKVAKISMALIMLVCVVLAWNPKTPVAELSVIAFGTIAVTIFPLWGAYFWKRATKWGAILSTVIGVGLNLLFFIIGGKNMVLNPQTSLFELNGFLVSMIAAGVIFFVVSFVTRPGEVENKSLAIFFHEALDDNGGGSSPARTVSQPGQAY